MTHRKSISIVQSLTSLSLSLMVSFSLFTAPLKTLAKDESQVFLETKEAQKMTILTSGIASLQKRLEMIASAKKSIEVEYFIYDLEGSPRVFTQALVKKAQEGVKIRVLIDHGFPVFVFDDYYAQQLKIHNIEVRYYNTAAILKVQKIQFRSHRKLLAVDGKMAMTGGRNIADEYFDIRKDYNFLDTDVLVEGTIASKMISSFNLFWNSKMTEAAKFPEPPQPATYGINPKFLNSRGEFLNSSALLSQQSVNPRAQVDSYKKALEEHRSRLIHSENLLVENEGDRKLLSLVKAQGTFQLQNEVSSICNDSLFIADFPGIDTETKILTKHLLEEVKKTKNSLYLESPYFVIKKTGNSLLEQLTEKGVNVNVMTNSLHSTDAFYTVPPFFPRVKQWIRKGVQFWIYDGSAPRDLTPEIEKVSSERWGIHSKVAVIDASTSIIGTYNVDPRSKNLNAEMAVICRNNPELAEALIRNFQIRAQQSAKLDQNANPEDGRSRYLDAPASKIFMYWLSMPLANLLDGLL